MLIDVVRQDSAIRPRHWRPVLLTGVALLTAAPLFAQAPPAPPPVTIGAGVQSSFISNRPAGGGGADGPANTNEFVLNSVRLYVNGTAANKVKFEFNTNYDGGTNDVTVLDAVAKFEVSGKFNIWAGRFLPPSDRANLYGPYFAHHWSVYSDGVQDGYPSVATGRDNGVAYWGQFDKVKVQAGVFDGQSATRKNNLIGAGRIQVDFWDAEPGYYLNGTYYGGKNLLALGLAGQVQDGDGAYSGDFLLEKKIPGGGSFTVEAELAKYDKLGGYDGLYATDSGGYVLGSYLFPPPKGVTGKFEILGKFAKASFSNGQTSLDRDYDQKTSEVNFNYIISDFKARVMFFFKNTTFSAIRRNFKQVGVGVQLQM